MTESTDLEVDQPDRKSDDPQHINTLAKSYTSIEQKINDHFETLKSAIELRKTGLIQELKSAYAKKLGCLNDSKIHTEPAGKLKSVIDSDKFEFVTDKYFSKDDPEISDLSTIIKNYGKLIQSSSTKLIDETRIFSNDQIECLLDGIGLKQCYVNEKSKFTLLFKSRDNTQLSKTNVNFLDIFIITSGETTSAAKSNFQTSRITLNEKTGTKKRLTTSSSSNSLANKSENSTRRCKCDCTLECLAEGYYAINYKLDKKGIYLLNILVNKVHVGDSPYKLKCLENSIKVPIKTESNAKMKRTNKTQSSYNISSGKASTGQMPHSNTNDDIRKVDRPLKTAVSRTNSMSHLSNVSGLNGTKKRAGSNTNIGNNNGFNFSTGPVYRSSVVNKTDDDLLINGILPLSANMESNGKFNQSQSELNATRSFKEDDFLFQIGSRGDN